MRMRAVRSSRSVGRWRSGPWIAPVMMSVMISVTRRTMSAFSTAAEPNARTIAAVTSGYLRSVRFERASTASTRPAGVGSVGGCEWR